MEYPNQFAGQEEMMKFVGQDDATSSYKSGGEHRVFNLESGDEAVYQKDEEDDHYKKMKEYQLSSQQVSKRKQFAPGGTGHKKTGRKLSKGKGKSSQIKKSVNQMKDDEEDEDGEAEESLQVKLREDRDADPLQIIPELSHNSTEACLNRLERFQIAESISMFNLSSTIEVLSEKYESKGLREKAKSMKRAEKSQDIERAHRIVDSVMETVQQIEEKKAEQEFINELKQGFSLLVDDGLNADQIIETLAEKYETSFDEMASALETLELVTQNEQREEGDHGSHGDYGGHGNHQVSEDEDEENNDEEEDEEDEEDEEAEESVEDPEFGEGIDVSGNREETISVNKTETVSGSQKATEDVGSKIDQIRSGEQEPDDVDESDGSEDESAEESTHDQSSDVDSKDLPLKERLGQQFTERDDEDIKRAIDRAEDLSEDVNQTVEQLAQTFLS